MNTSFLETINIKICSLPIWAWVCIVIVVYLLINMKSEHFENVTSDNEFDMIMEKSLKKLAKELNVSLSKLKSNQENSKTPKVAKILNFNTSWCGWSKKFQPEWDKFSDYVNNTNLPLNIKAVDVKCDVDSNKGLCEKYEIPGFPSVVIVMSDGSHFNYEGERECTKLCEAVAKTNNNILKKELLEN